MERIAKITGLIVSVLTVCSIAVQLNKGVKEYQLQGRAGRAKMLSDFLDHYMHSSEYKKIRNYLEYEEKHQDSLATIYLKDSISVVDKFNILLFYEEVALAMQSGLVDPAVVHYMLGEMAIRIYNSKGFWLSLKDYKEDFYSGLFSSFVQQMLVERDRAFKAVKNDRLQFFQSLGH